MIPPPLWRDLRVADAATLLNAVLGLAAIVLAATGRPLLAAELVLLGIIVDGVDGALARVGLGGGPLGATLDTLADAVTFGVAPAVLVVLLDPTDPVLAGAGALMLAAVLVRLARFHARPDPDHFHGLSSPGGALVVAAVVLADLGDLALLAAVLVAAGLMVSRLPLPKLRGRLGITAVALLVAVLATHGRPEQTWAILAILAFLLLYLIAGPPYLRRTTPEPT